MAERRTPAQVRQELHAERAELTAAARTLSQQTTRGAKNAAVALGAVLVAFGGTAVLRRGRRRR